MIKIRVGSTVQLVMELQYEDGTPIDLTNVSEITLYLKDISTGEEVYSGACTIISASDGIISHTWADTTNLRGVYEREFKLTYSDGSVDYIPSESLEYIMFW